MYKIQKLQDQNWGADQTLRFNCETLVDQISGHPLHVAEVIIVAKLNVTTTAGIDGDLLPQVIGRIEVVPNEVCEASRLDGDSCHKLDHMLTGRYTEYPDIGGIVSQAPITVAVRIPYHGCLFGTKVGNYADAVQPVRRFWRGGVNVQCTGATPITDLTIDGGVVTVMFVTEPLQASYNVGPMPVYDLFTRPAGPSFDWVSKGRLMLLGVAPLAPDDDSGDYDTFTIPDACWVQGLTPIELLTAWQAMQSFGGEADTIRGEDIISDFIPILWNRPCSAKLWTDPAFLRGNRNVEVVGSSVSDHRVVTAQLLTSGNYTRQLEVDVRRKALNPKVQIADADDAAKVRQIYPWMPRRIPLSPQNRERVAAAIRRRNRRR